MKAWQALGAKVTVVTCAPNFPRGKVYPGYRNRWYQRRDEDGVDVIRVWSYISANAGFTKRILDYVSYAVSAVFAALPLDFDLIVATSPQFFTAVAGRVVSALRRRPWVMEVRDLWPESIRAVGAARGPRWLFDRLEALELSLYRSAALVVVVTESFRDNLIDRGIPPKKLTVVTNGVDASAFTPRPRPAALEARLGLTGKTVVGYFGTHGLAHGLPFILSTAASAPAHVHFLFVGDGAMKGELVEQRAQLGLANVTLLPPVPKAEIGNYLALADIALVPLRRSDTFRSVIPSKIFESAATGTPILLGVEGESRRIVERYGAGLAYTPEDSGSFLAQLRILATDAQAYESCRVGALRLAADYDRDVLAARMYAELLGIVAAKTQATYA